MNTLSKDTYSTVPTDQFLLLYSIGKYQEILTNTDQKILIQYLTLVILSEACRFVLNFYSLISNCHWGGN